MALFGHGVMSELSPLSGVKLKSDFGTVRAAFDHPKATRAKRSFRSAQQRVSNRTSVNNIVLLTSAWSFIKLTQPVQSHLILRTRGSVAILDCAKSNLDVVWPPKCKEGGNRPAGRQLREARYDSRGNQSPDEPAGISQTRRPRPPRGAEPAPARGPGRREHHPNSPQTGPP